MVHEIHAYLVVEGFCNSPIDNTLYIKRIGDVLLVIILYVNHMLHLTYPNDAHILTFIVDLERSFDMLDPGKLRFYLEIKIW